MTRTAYTVTCPKCGAVPGVLCTRPNGQYTAMMPSPHKARTISAQGLDKGLTSDKIDASTNHSDTKEPVMTATRTRTRKAAAPLTAAQVARDAGIDPRAFRAFLRKLGLNSRRGFADKRAARAAVNRYRKEA